MNALGEPKLSGLVPIPALVGVELIRIPPSAAQPAHLCIRNVDGAATVYLKTAKIGEGWKVSTTDYGIRLAAGEGYDWMGCPPRGVAVVAISTVAGSLAAVEANWAINSDPDFD